MLGSAIICHTLSPMIAQTVCQTLTQRSTNPRWSPHTCHFQGHDQRKCKRATEAEAHACPTAIASRLTCSWIALEAGSLPELPLWWTASEHTGSVISTGAEPWSYLVMVKK